MSTRVERLRSLADDMCARADAARARGDDSLWRLYVSAARLRDRAYLLDEQEFYRKWSR